MKTSKSFCTIIIGAVVLTILATLSWAQTQPQFARIEITLEGTTPPISDQLSVFLTTAGPAGQAFTRPFVGFQAADIGQGAGDGVDEDVPFSFRFPRFQEITAARLGLTLTPNNGLVTTDNLLFADVGHDFAYGRSRFANLAPGQRTVIVLDLKNIDEIETAGETPTGNQDVTRFLLDGSLDVVYADDATIERAFLFVEGVPAEPIPPISAPNATQTVGGGKT